MTKAEHRRGPPKHRVPAGCAPNWRPSALPPGRSAKERACDLDRFRCSAPPTGSGPSERGVITTHEFSFGEHYDPERISFGPLVAHNVETLEPGSGYEPHVHRDVEIVTWVTDGSLEHDDDHGHPHACERRRSSG